MLSEAHRLFVTTAELGSFSSAAKKLHKSPSAVSKQIQSLETKLSVKLFERTTRSLKLTEAGQYYFERCRGLIAELEEANRQLEGFTEKTDGQLKITLAASLAAKISHDVLSKFSETYPKYRYELVIKNEDLDIVDESIDFAFRQGPLKDTSQIGIKIFDMEPMFCASPKFLETHPKPGSLESLFDIPLAIPSYINLTKKVRPFFSDLNWLRLERTHRINDINAILALGLDDISAIFTFKHLAQPYLDRGALINITPVPSLPKIPVFLIYHGDNFMAPAKSAFVDLVKSTYL